jgi:hypothetical protein
VGKHSPERRSPLPLVLSAVAIVAVVVAGFVLVRLYSGSSDVSSGTAAGLTTPSASGSASSSGTSTSDTSSATTSTATTTATTSPTTTATTSAADAAARTALQACVDRQNAAKPVLDTIATGAGHWNDHVQAQTDLNSGARSLIDVKENTWGPTRAAGPGDVAAYQAAQAAFTSAPACPTSVGQLPAPADVAPKLQACAAREQALDNVLSTGDLVIGDWRTHLSEMADHADGHIDSYQAQMNWLKRWAEAPAHLDPYKAAVAALAGAPGCSP